VKREAIFTEVKVSDDSMIYVIHLLRDNFSALGPICTHEKEKHKNNGQEILKNLKLFDNVYVFYVSEILHEEKHIV
jgi:hypothetical protein